MVSITFSTVVLLVSMTTACVHGLLYQRKRLSSFPECGASNPNGNFINQTEPENPGPFHDLTTNELRKLREFLENDPTIKAVKSSNATLNSSYIFTAELLLAKKKDILKHLEEGGPQPIRQAHVTMFRGDKTPPVVEELVCSPLPDVSKCELLNRTSRRNPVEFSLRAINGVEIKSINEVILKKVDETVGPILMESYGGKFTECSSAEDCLASSSAPVGTGITEDISKRLIWVTAMYNLPYPTVHVLNFAVLVNLNDTDTSKWTIEKVWYSNTIFDSMEELVSKYNNNSIPKTKIHKPVNDGTLYSSLRRRGDPLPVKPQRPPRLVEPDGKRYTVNEKKVEYMGWTFNYRLSPVSGPAIYDVTFKGERIVYELALSEIAVRHSGFAPVGQTMNDVESSRMIGSRSKALVPGADCPETATLLSAVFMSQYSEEPAVYDAAMCLFENSDGHAMRRHLAYTIEEGGFYGGMMDTQLIVRSSVSMFNNDYIFDFWFHQNGVLHAKMTSTVSDQFKRQLYTDNWLQWSYVDGYIQTAFFSSAEKPYGHRIHDNIVENIHQYLVHFKVDLDVGGTSNRYETLGIHRENVSLTAFMDRPYSQTKITTTLKTTEKEAVYDFDFSSSAYHIVHNKDKKNKYNESRAYRIEMRGPSKSLVEENLGHEKSISWARHQMVVTKRKEDEASSSSIYAMMDSHRPTVNFTSYYEDDENIVDEDLVFWITGGIYHISRSEDLPNTQTVGNHINLFLLPHNYFPECPSMGSRDSIYIDYKDPTDPSKGVKVDRNGNSIDQCVVPKSILEDLEENPDRIMESRRRSPTDL